MPGIVGFAAAYRAADARRGGDVTRYRALDSRLLSALDALGAEFAVNGPRRSLDAIPAGDGRALDFDREPARVPYIVNLRFPDVPPIHLFYVLIGAEGPWTPSGCKRDAGSGLILSPFPPRS